MPVLGDAFDNLKDGAPAIVKASPPPLPASPASRPLERDPGHDNAPRRRAPDESDGHVDHARLHQEPGLRDDGDDRHRGARHRSYPRLRVEKNPDVNLPFVLVLTSYPGATPEVVETDVTKPIEYAINTVSGASADPVQLQGRPQRGVCRVPDVDRHEQGDAGRARQDRAVRRISRDVKDPLVVRLDIEDHQPTVSLAVLSPTLSLRELTSLTDQTIVKALENISGVAQSPSTAVSLVRS